MQAFAHHLDAIAAARTNKTVKDAAAAVLSNDGFDRWLYACDNPYGKLGLPITLANEYGAWILTYTVKGYQKIDPVLAHCRANTDPVMWDATVGWETAEPSVQAFMKDVAAHGFGSGVAIPLHEFEESKGLLSLTHPAPLAKARPLFEEALPRLVQIGQTMHRTIVCRLQKKVM